MSQQWIPLESVSQLDEIRAQKGFQLIFKHSTRCSVSAMAKRRFENDWHVIPFGIHLYFLDLLQHRDLSKQIAELFKVHHESPQILLIKDGECVLDASHSEIYAEEVKEVMESLGL